MWRSPTWYLRRGVVEYLSIDITFPHSLWGVHSLFFLLDHWELGTSCIAALMTMLSSSKILMILADCTAVPLNAIWRHGTGGVRPLHINHGEWGSEGGSDGTESGWTNKRATTISLSFQTSYPCCPTCCTLGAGHQEQSCYTDAGHVITWCYRAKVHKNTTVPRVIARSPPMASRAPRLDSNKTRVMPSSSVHCHILEVHLVTS